MINPPKQTDRKHTPAGWVGGRLTWKSCSFLSLVNDGEGDNGLGRDPLRWDELSEGEWAGRVALVELEVPPSVPGPNPGVTDLHDSFDKIKNVPTKENKVCRLQKI